MCAPRFAAHVVAFWQLPQAELWQGGGCVCRVGGVDASGCGLQVLRAGQVRGGGGGELVTYS